MNVNSLEKIRSLFIGRSEYTEQAIVLIESLSLTEDEFLMVTNLQNVDSLQGFEWATRFLNASLRNCKGSAF